MPSLASRLRLDIGGPRLVAILISSTAAIAISTESKSQTSGQIPAHQEKNDKGLETIVVTATRQARSLQKVAVSVDVIGAKEFRASALKNPSELQYLSPSVQTASFGGAGFTVRGVGTNAVNTATEQAVGLVIDNIVYGFVDDIGADLTGLKDVEVLRGPQGTTFGKNSAAGVINISTQRPSFSGVWVDTHTTYGSYNDTNSYVNVNVPISAKIATMFSVAYQNRDGFSYNPVRNAEEGGENQVAYRGKVLYEPTDDLTFYLSADYRSNRMTPDGVITARTLGAEDGLGLLNYGIYPSAINTETGATSDAERVTNTGGVSLQIDDMLGGGYTLSSITGLRFLARKSLITNGATPTEYLNSIDVGHGTQVSQEIKLASPSTGLFQYVAGAYYYDRLTFDNAVTAGPYGGLAEELYGPGALIATDSGRQFSSNNVRNFAVYGEGAFHFTPWFRFIMGVRATYDQGSASLRTVPEPGVYPLPGGSILPPTSADVQDRNISWRVGPQIDINKNIMAYATATQGFKGALAVATTAGINAVQPEQVRAYEIGIKSTLLRRRLLVDFDLFYEHFKDFQTSVLDNELSPPGFVLGNAGGLTTKGAELNIVARPFPELTLNGGVTYQEATYSDFVTSCYANQQATDNSSGVGGCYHSSAGSAGFTQAAGSPLNNASKWNFVLSMAYAHPVTSRLTADASVITNYRTNFFTTGYIPATKIGSYGTTTINIGVGTPDGRWRVGLFVRNLFDRYFVAAIVPGQFDIGSYTNTLAAEARRTVGGQLDYRF